MENTYWNNKGKYQKEADILHKELVPIEGDASTLKGQLLRFASNVYYDHYNNGDCNFDVKKDQWNYLTKLSGVEEFKEAYDILYMYMSPVECSFCSGVGEADCWECDGGLIECEDCNGEGCDSCDEGYADCYYCGGSAQMVCDECNGDGEIEASYFEGDTDKLEQLLETGLDKLINNIMNGVYDS